MNKVASPLSGALELGTERLKLLGVLTGGHFFIHWFQQLFPVVVPTIKAALGLNDVQVGALNSVRQLAMGTLDFPLGVLADSAARHRSVILASALGLMGTAYFLMGAGPFFFAALCSAGLLGLGTALWHPAAAASLSQRFPERRATALSVHGMGATVSDTLTPLAAGLLLVSFPWETVLSFQLLPALLLGLLVWYALAGLFSDLETRPSRSKRIREIARLALNPAFIGVASATGLLQMGRLVVITFLPIYLQEHLRYSPFVLGIYIALLHAMGTVSQPVLGFLADRFGRKAVLLPSFVTLGVLFVLLGVVPAGIPLGLVVIAIGLFFYTLMNIVHSAVMDVADSSIQASSFGLTNLVTQAAVIPTPMVAGFLIGIYGIRFSFLVAGALVILGAIVLAPLKLYRGSRITNNLQLKTRRR